MTRGPRTLPDFPPEMRKLLQAVRETLDGEAYLVGGFVRDCLLGRPAADLDLAVTGNAGEAAARLAEKLQGHDFPLDDERDQHRVTLNGDMPVQYVDVVQLRGSIEADMVLRDFTVDAMAAALEAEGSTGPVIDPLGGLADLEGRRLRLASEGALADDPLRMLRAVRLAVELEFTLDGATAEAVRANKARLTEAAAERQRDEIARLLATPRAGTGLRLLDDLRLLEVVVPEITAARGVSQPKEHYWDVFDHSLETVAALDALLHADSIESRWTPFRAPLRDVMGWYPLDDYFAEVAGGHSRLVLTKLAALLHDVAKPETKAPDKDGRIRFLGHADVGAATAKQICTRLRFGRRETGYVSHLVEEHLRPTQLSSGGVPTDRAIFRFFRDLGAAAVGCLVLSLADAAAAVGPRLTRDRWRGYVAYISHVLERRQEQEQKLPARHKLSGNTIMAALAIEPGPLVGQIQRAVDEAAATGEVSSEEEALTFARMLYKTWRQEPTATETGRP